MNINDILLNVKDASFSQIVCQTEITTLHQMRKYNEQGYNITMTLADFREKFPQFDPANIFYTPVINMRCFYFNEKTLASAPFHMDMMFLNSSIMSPELAAEMIKEQEKKVAAGIYDDSMRYLPDRMRIEYLTKLYKLRGNQVKNLYQLFFDTYKESDYGFRGMDEETLQVILASKTEKEKARTEAALQALPDTVTIYRGGNTESTPYREAYSWTLDINVANFFAIRHGHGPGYIAKGKIQKKDIIDVFLDDRNEKEVIVSPHDVTVREVIHLHGLDMLQETLPVVARTYRSYLGKLEHLTFTKESEAHGKAHSARVLLLSLLIAEMMELSQDDREILADAAIYHDTRRTHDGDDRFHGDLAAEYYCKHASKPKKLVELLCTCHCLPDDEGMALVEEYYKQPRALQRAKRLLSILKDADALDRVRFGTIGEPDLEQLRLPISRELTLVAEITHRQLKI